MNLSNALARAMLSAALFVAVLSAAPRAGAASFRLYCQGALNTTGSSSSESTDFVWAAKGAGAQSPGEGQCAWADRGPNSAEKAISKLCGDLAGDANLPRGKYMVIGVHIDKGESCLKVTEHGGFVEPPFSANPALPTITALNGTNACGGTLHVSGAGFWPGGLVQLSVKNAPGAPGLQKIGTAVGTADSAGNVTIDVPYSTSVGSGLPGCAFSSSSTVNVTIIAKDEKSDLNASTKVSMRNCGIDWTACPA